MNGEIRYRLMTGIITAVVVSLGAAVSAPARDSFGPWAADVAVGDDAVRGLFAEGHHGCGGCSGAAGMDRGVYDAFTGGSVLLIRVFQIWISPLDGPSCRYQPVCSAYGRMAVQKYGALLGGILAGDRILRCNIFSRAGKDPVPDLAPGN